MFDVLAVVVALFHPAGIHLGSNPVQGKRDPPVICVDPGHPSEISDGLQRVNGTTETHENWLAARKLQELLKSSGYRVVMTKSRELQHVANERRAAIANRSHARLLIRLHCDTGSGSGFRVFYPDRAARDHGVVGPSRSIREESKSAASAILDGLTAAVNGHLESNGVAPDRSTAVGRKRGALIGSIHSTVPVVLVEMVFLNNSSDAAFIKSESGRDQIARGIRDGILKFVPVSTER